MDGDEEAYILLLLSDSNLPTGSFVASAGLESYISHGFAALPQDKLNATINFLRDSLATYAHSALPFVSDTHLLVKHLLDASSSQSSEALLESTLSNLETLDDLYEAMTLNHVARRASKSQGVALLTLYSKGFTVPKGLGAKATLSTPRQALAGLLVDKLKLMIRQDKTHGHLPVCWGVLASCLGLSLDRSQFLHLFLHARSLLSASVRLNTLGPYAAQQLLLHAVRPLVQEQASQCKNFRTGLRFSRSEERGTPADDGFDETTHGPAVTWPLGEILAARHDLQHSRIFNS